MNDLKISLPIALPFSFDTSKKSDYITLPITLPFSFENSASKRKITCIAFKEHVNLDKYYGKSILPYKEKTSDSGVSIPFYETAWFFPGLILSENVITHRNTQLNIVENVQALILVDFELISSNTLKLKWYGNNVPSLTIMKKTYSDEEYTADQTYDWSIGEATVDITNDDYNIYLLGTSNSGSSSVYTIGGTDSKLVETNLDVLVNDKIYTMAIDFTSVYKFTINY